MSQKPSLMKTPQYVQGALTSDTVLAICQCHPGQHHGSVEVTTVVGVADDYDTGRIGAVALSHRPGPWRLSIGADFSPLRRRIRIGRRGQTSGGQSVGTEAGLYLKAIRDKTARQLPSRPNASISQSPVECRLTRVIQRRLTLHSLNFVACYIFV